MLVSRRCPISWMCTGEMNGKTEKSQPARKPHIGDFPWVHLPSTASIRLKANSRLANPSCTPVPHGSHDHHEAEYLPPRRQVGRRFIGVGDFDAITNSRQEELGKMTRSSPLKRGNCDVTNGQMNKQEPKIYRIVPKPLPSISRSATEMLIRRIVSLQHVTKTTCEFRETVSLGCRASLTATVRDIERTFQEYHITASVIRLR